MAGSPRTSRHRPYGGELSLSAARAHATGTPLAAAAAVSSSPRRVFPIPASPVHSTQPPLSRQRVIKEARDPRQLAVTAHHQRGHVGRPAPHGATISAGGHGCLESLFRHEKRAVEASAAASVPASYS